MKKQLTMILVFGLLLSVFAFAQFIASSGVVSTPSPVPAGGSANVEVSGWQFVYAEPFMWTGTQWVSAGSFAGTAQSGWLAIPSGGKAELTLSSVTSDKTLAIFACNQISSTKYDCNGDVVLDNNNQVISSAAKWMLHTVTTSTGSTCTPVTQACTVGTGACASTGTQTKTCSGGVLASTFGPCVDASGTAVIAGTPAATDTCGNGIDEDCDGADAVCPAAALVNLELFVMPIVPSGAAAVCSPLSMCLETCTATAPDLFSCRKTFSTQAGNKLNIDAKLKENSGTLSSSWNVVDLRVVAHGTLASPTGFSADKSCTGNTCTWLTGNVPDTTTYTIEARARPSTSTGTVPASTLVPIAALNAELTPSKYSILNWPTSYATLNDVVKVKNTGGADWNVADFALSLKVFDGSTLLATDTWALPQAVSSGSEVSVNKAIARPNAPGKTVTMTWQMTYNNMPFGQTASRSWYIVP